MAKKKWQCICPDYFLKKLIKAAHIILSNSQDKEFRYSFEHKNIAKVVIDEGKTQPDHRNGKKDRISYTLNIKSKD
jgi:hypothetical protein